jgi:hypothetical protein
MKNLYFDGRKTDRLTLPTGKRFMMSAQVSSGKRAAI